LISVSATRLPIPIPKDATYQYQSRYQKIILLNKENLKVTVINFEVITISSLEVNFKLTSGEIILSLLKKVRKLYLIFFSSLSLKTLFMMAKLLEPTEADI
jgi:hypothetical protein